MEKIQEFLGKVKGWQTGIGLIFASLGSFGLFGVEPGEEGIIVENYDVIIQSITAIVGSVMAIAGVFGKKKE